MKVLLLRDQKIKHNAGEIVEVSPDVYDYLIATESAKPAETEQAKPKRKR